MHGVDYYQVLGVSPSASSTQIKARYKTLAKKFHPDLNGDAKKMAHLNEAYRVLSDPEARQKYNQTIDLPRASARHHHDNSDGYVYTPHTRSQSTTRPRPQPARARTWTPPKRKSNLNKWLWATTFVVLLSILLGAGLHGPSPDSSASGLTSGNTTQSSPSSTLHDTPPTSAYTDPTTQDTAPNSSTDTNGVQQPCSHYRKRTRSYANCINSSTNCDTNSYYNFGC